ncbi:MAG: serine/threonine-protein kinase [Verrucomicrobiota bacterium]
MLGTIRVTEILAKGGMGMTFLGTMLNDSSQRVVVKIPLTAESDILDRFKIEVRILSDLSHPNIVRFIEAGESDILIGNETRKLPWLAMEYVSGSGLRATLKQKPKADWRDVQILVENVLQALNHLHSKNLCHRDIKPDNLIYDPKAATWKLVDFGIAKELMANLKHTITMVDSNPGAWDYMSPEQLSGKSANIRSDIYSLGRTAWEALIGDVPRAGTRYPSDLLGPGKVPPDVDTLIAKMTEHRVEDRYQSPAEALQALKKGATAIQDGETRRKKQKQLLLCLAIAGATAATAAVVWLAGNQFETQHAKDIVDSVPQSDTRYTRIRHKLEIFRNHHPFWGRRYADDQYAKTEQRAVAERQKMKETFAAITKELTDTGHPDDYKFNRCENYCKTYEEVFGDTSEVKAMLTQRAILDARMIAAKADTLAAKGQTKEAIGLCDRANTKVSLPEAATIIAETRARIVDAYVKEKLVGVEILFSAKTEQDLRQAQIILVQIEKTVGPTPATHSALKKADDILWSLASDEAGTALARNDLDTACRAYDRYIEVSELKAHKAEAAKSKDTAIRKADDALYSSAVDNANAHLKRKEYDLARAEFDKYLELAPLKAHREDAVNAKEKIREIEDNDDWATVTTSADQNVRQHTFKQAIEDYEHYLKKWPSGRHAAEARQAMDQVVGKHFQFLGEIKNYDDFLEEFNKVCEMYPSEHARLQTARNWLVFHTHAEIGRLYREVNNKNLLPSTALDKVSQLKYTKVDLEKRQYLDRLAEAMKARLQRPTLQSANRFLYWWQRPPGDCVKMDAQPTVFYITVQSVMLNLSETLYTRIKGTMGFDADPKVRINLCRDSSSDNYPIIDEIFSTLGAVNQRSFSVTVRKSLFYEKGIETLNTILDDADLTGDSNILSAAWTQNSTGSSQSFTRTFSDGSTITLYYDQQ